MMKLFFLFCYSVNIFVFFFQIVAVERMKRRFRRMFHRNATEKQKTKMDKTIDTTALYRTLIHTEFGCARTVHCV